MVSCQGHTDEVLQSHLALIILTDEIEDSVEEALDKIPNSGKVMLSCEIQLIANTRMIQGYDANRTISSLDIMWEVDDLGVLHLKWEVALAHIPFDKAALDNRHLSSPKVLVLNYSFQVCLKYHQLHISVGDGAIHDSTTVCHMLQDIIMTWDVLAPSAISISVMQVYDAKGNIVAIIQDLVHCQAASNIELYYLASSATIIVAKHRVHLQDFEIVKSLESIVVPLQPPDIPLKITIETIEIKSPICVCHVSMLIILDVSSIHVLQVDAAKCQLFGGNEEIDVWHSMAKSGLYDNTKVPFAKVMAMSYLVKMKGIVQATSTLPFDTLRTIEGHHNTTLGSILQYYSRTFASMIQQ